MRLYLCMLETVYPESHSSAVARLCILYYVKNWGTELQMSTLYSKSSISRKAIYQLAKHYMQQVALSYSSYIWNIYSKTENAAIPRFNAGC